MALRPLLLPAHAEIRALAATHADKRVGSDELLDADRAALDTHLRRKVHR